MRRSQILVLSLVLFGLVLVGVVPQPVIFACADSIDDVEPAADTVDVVQDGTRVDDNVSTDEDTPSDDPRPLPPSLAKATRVGAKIREVEESLEHAAPDPESEIKNPQSNAEEVQPDPKVPLDGCHWGAMGCNKAKRNPGGGGEVNSSSVEADDDSDNAQGDSDIKSPHSSSSLAGSATAKIEAMKRRGGQRRPGVSPPVWERDTTESDNNNKSDPPHGFKLAGRIVTSPSDGLSYFLDPPQVDSKDRGGDWMMTIPYAYLDCGPTIESTTEAFSLTDMVVRHFPVGASMGHWSNLAGGVTIESDMTEGGEEKGTKYIDGNSLEGHPKLLVALSPIEITVSGNDEERRIFHRGEVVLMEDTIGKGHQMRAALDNHDNPEFPRKPDGHGQDMSVLMVTLPHTIHLPMYDWLEEASYLHDGNSAKEPSAEDSTSSTASPPTSYGAEDALFGLAPKHLHHKHRSLRKFSTNTKKPCPLEYDSAYSSLFMPTHNQYRRNRRSGRKRHIRWSESQNVDSTFDEYYPPPPGFTTYSKDSVLFDYLPSLRRTMLFGIGLSLTSSFIYCVQLLYPPLLALWGGGSMILGGMVLNILATRWGYRRFVADWEEEWRWKREVRKNKQQEDNVPAHDDDNDSDGTFSSDDVHVANNEATNNHSSDGLD